MIQLITSNFSLQDCQINLQELGGLLRENCITFDQILAESIEKL